MSNKFKDVTVVIKTLIRYGVARSTIAAFRKIDSAIKIIVIDDTPADLIQPLEGVEHIITEEDIGLCAGRNLGFRLATTDIVIYTDDDAPPIMSLSELTKAVQLIRDGVDFLGWCGFTITSEEGQKPTLARVRVLEDLQEVDATENAFIARRDFLLAHPYDDRIKINGEHFSHFLKLFKKGIKVHTHACMKFKNLTTKNKAYNAYRNRGQFRRYAKEATGYANANWRPQE